jgi:HK97 gp10 family phage protein
MKAVAKLDQVIKGLEGETHLKPIREFLQREAEQHVPVQSGRLKESIKAVVGKKEGQLFVRIEADAPYATFVEFGTGPRGMANHEGTDPKAQINYRTSPWYIHESQVDAETAERYHWKKIRTKQGVFYLCYGQPAQPFLYPSVNDNAKEILRLCGKGIEGEYK